MSQNEPNWRFYLFDKDDGLDENISPNWTKANDEAKKSAAREKGFKILLMVRSTVIKKTQYHTRPSQT